MATRKKKATARKAPARKAIARKSAARGGEGLGKDRARGPQEPTEDQVAETTVIKAFDRIAGDVPSGQLTAGRKKDVARQLLVDLGLREPDPDSAAPSGPS
jgi:hypothetical protein